MVIIAIDVSVKGLFLFSWRSPFLSTLIGWRIVLGFGWCRSRPAKFLRHVWHIHILPDNVAEPGPGSIRYRSERFGFEPLHGFDVGFRAGCIAHLVSSPWRTENFSSGWWESSRLRGIPRYFTMPTLGICYAKSERGQYLFEERTWFYSDFRHYRFWYFTRTIIVSVGWDASVALCLWRENGNERRTLLCTRARLAWCCVPSVRRSYIPNTGTFRCISCGTPDSIGWIFHRSYLRFNRSVNPPPYL